MDKQISYLQWRARLNEITPSDMRLGEDVLLIEGRTPKEMKDTPFKVDATTCIIYRRGGVRFMVNMKEFWAEAPCMVVLPADAIIATLDVSADIDSDIVVMSRNFSDSLFTAHQNMSPLYKAILDNPIIDLKDVGVQAIEHYYQMLKSLVTRSDSPYALEAARHLTMALFYAFTSGMHTTTALQPKSRGDEIFEQFVELLRANYKSQHELGYYAEQMCLTPKYLSKAVRMATGRTATEWIDDYVTTESKALLSSTQLTVQQISDQLGFRSQSLFGKFFKRVVGLSPREYRNQVVG